MHIVLVGLECLEETPVSVILHAACTMLDNMLVKFSTAEDTLVKIGHYNILLLYFQE